jgi:hypothetical protein
VCVREPFCWYVRGSVAVGPEHALRYVTYRWLLLDPAFFPGTQSKAAKVSQMASVYELVASSLYVPRTSFAIQTYTSSAPINSACISHTAPDYALCVSAGQQEYLNLKKMQAVRVGVALLCWDAGRWLGYSVATRDGRYY